MKTGEGPAGGTGALLAHRMGHGDLPEQSLVVEFRLHIKGLRHLLNMWSPSTHLYFEAVDNDQGLSLCKGHQVEYYSYKLLSLNA